MPRQRQKTIRYAAAAGFGIAIGIGLAYVRRDRTVVSALSPNSRTENPQPITQTQTGMGMIDGRLIITDPTAAFRYIATVVDPLFYGGQIPSSEKILIEVLSHQFPEYDWPPPENSERMPQWDLLRTRIDRLLARDHYPPSPGRLRVVRSE
jgi:hypothetical protein